MSSCNPITVTLQLAERNYLANYRARAAADGITTAVAQHDTAAIIDRILPLLAMQGISDAAAMTFQQRHGSPAYEQIVAILADHPTCPRLQSWWHFECGYQKTQAICREPSHIASCPLPTFNLRKGALNQAAFGLTLFVRDCCEGDVVAWVDRRLAEASSEPDPLARVELMSDALVLPFAEVPGIGRKLAGMVVAELLLGGDPAKERWLAAGAATVVIDSLVHNALHRTGILRQHQAEHRYGPRCWAPGGCADVIRAVARAIDASTYDRDLPRYAPRYLCAALWRFATEAASGWGICSGLRIDDYADCKQSFCPAGLCCERVPLHPAATATQPVYDIQVDYNP